MRVIAVGPDALVLTSRMWMTNAVALRAPGGGEAMLVDSPYFPDELEALPALLEQAGFRIDALLATHADFDHLLASLAFPGKPLGVGEPSMLRIRSEPGAAQRELRDADAHHYVERRAPLGLGSVKSLPVPGKLELGDGGLELHPAFGHTVDGTAFLYGGASVLVAGDYLSGVEIPMISPGGDLDSYRSTLGSLAQLVERVETVVPGHGPVHDRDAALRVLEEDLSYLDRLAGGASEGVALPEGRSSARQRQIHADNISALA